MTSVLYQLDIIYNGLDLELRRDIKRPDNKSTINSFLAGMDDSKHEWWAYAHRHGRNPGTPLGISQGNRQPRLPDNNRGDNQFQSRQYQQWQGPGVGRQPFPPCYQQNAYYRVSSSTVQMLTQINSRLTANTGQQSSRPNVSLPPARQPLQITGPSTSGSPTQPGRPQFGRGMPGNFGGGRGNQGFQRPWQQQGGYRPTATAYRATAEHERSDGNEGNGNN